MRKNNTYRTGQNCVFELHAHLVFITKYRGAVFADNHLRSLESIFRSVCTDFETELVEFNGEADHVHLLVNSLKGVSSRRLKLLHPELVKPAYMKNALWSPSYYAGSVGGAPISVIRQYIEQQARPH
ncbi:IS200/IS605 family transposase [Thiopseudomonas alkaliphila]|uniref:IS200/IS605 family transposase n=1 Tax=Thiopseudomonas alkaliphila TaxID=1697053 RepID=A0AAW7DLV1_9GAMM|nr:IS200/IS605 family transposase [Thiopseudomonas alkaliphila]MDM1695092.1 IS200/IS605 family transposase [Thiopseudomonas alkaliphila]